MDTLNSDNVYVGVFKNNLMIGVLLFLTKEHITTEFVDKLHDNGFILKSITKSEYDNFDSGDELTIDDLKNGNFTFEK